MSEPLTIHRAIDPDVTMTGDGRTVTLRLLTFDTDYTVSDDGGQHFYAERWAPSAFKRTLKHGHGDGIPLTWEHPAMHGMRPMPLGVSDRAWDDDGSLMLVGRIHRTNEGDSLVECLRERSVRGASIEAAVYESKATVGGFERRQARLLSVGFTTRPAYADAELVALRSEPPQPTTPRLDALRETLKLWPTEV